MIENIQTIQNQLVYTAKDRCRVCYTCVRECPAKAIRIVNGQADIIGERCIACGNCVKVCSQQAKLFKTSIKEVDVLLKSPSKVAAIIAPSFPAEFMELPDHTVFVGMVRKLGFDLVNEVAFGADLVALQFKELLESAESKRYITSDCPAIVSFIKKYHPNLVGSLSPIVSPMVATARVLHHIHGNSLKIVFIGPCIAKKGESDEIDEILTFKELKEMFDKSGVNHTNVTTSKFDPPLAGKGAIFPVTRGLIQTVELEDSLDKGNIIVAEGKENFPEAIREFEKGLINTENLELLCCDGCIMGAGMANSANRYAKTNFISQYVRNKLKSLDKEQWNNDIESYRNLDFTRTFNTDDKRESLPSKVQIDAILKQMGKFDPKDHLNCGACGYATCEKHAIAILNGFAEIEMCLPFTIEKLHNSIEELNISNDKLASARQALKQSEKLASMGQLSAGIAHELNNPLGVVIMYANILLDETVENDPIRDDLKLIVEQADRCKKIVGGLLNFARKSQVKSEDTDLLALAEQSFTSIIIPQNIQTHVYNRMRNKIAQIDHEQMLQVITNLNKNAIEAMPEGGKLTITLSETDDDLIVFTISDTGIGIAKDNIEKVFEPFFTTKGIGKGTGLGLATSYGIIKMHKGKIHVDSNNDISHGPLGTTFKIEIPRKNN